ncbi:hypothetical protein [Candidatus Mesenet endosymbiont of Phosphuga atrata]|uniref:hypothetical protein n=1 Tax=Candidatus Mesenet endosymbiont of Phosphuga atrata TaxID=3066221 RepID=UPI0030D082BE
MTMKAMNGMFSIDRKTLYWWRKRREETGSIKLAYSYQIGHRSKIKDMDSFFKFLQDNQG